MAPVQKDTLKQFIQLTLMSDTKYKFRGSEDFFKLCDWSVLLFPAVPSFLTWSCIPLRLWPCLSRQGFHTDRGTCTSVYSVSHSNQSYTSSPRRCRCRLPAAEGRWTPRRTTCIHAAVKSALILIHVSLDVLTIWAMRSKLKPESLTMSPSLNIGQRGASSGW